MTKTLSNLNDDTELLLGDSSNLVFAASTEVQPAVLNAIKEASAYVPHRTVRWVTARHYKKNIDTSSIDPIDVRYAVYPVLLKDTDGDLISDGDVDHNRRNVEWEGDTARVLLDYAPYASETDTLTGTVTFTSGSTAITGSGTAFTAELRVGYYICKNTEWYRVASITSDTALVLGRNVVVADDGADSSGGTGYWRSDVLLACDEEHYITIQTDLNGAIDAGVTGGYAQDVWKIHVDDLGTGTMDKGTLFTIAGTDGTYRLTADATIVANECDLYIEPALLDRAVENAVVTFKASSLKPKLERLVAELAASHLAINWTYDARSQFDLAVTDLASALAEITLANPEIDKAVIEAALINPEVDSAKTEVGLANPEVDLAKTDIASGRALANTVPTGGGITDYLNAANSEAGAAQGYLSSGSGYLSIANGYRNSTQAFLSTGNGFLGTAAGYLRQAGQRLTVANLQLSLHRLGWDRYNRTLMELRRMASPQIFHSYSRD